MTREEVQQLRHRWLPYGHWSRPSSDIEDANRMLDEIEHLQAQVALAVSQLAECQLLLEDVAASTRPIPGGLGERAAQLLREQYGVAEAAQT